MNDKLKRFRNTLDPNVAYRVENENYNYAFPRDMAEKDLVYLSGLSKKDLQERKSGLNMGSLIIE